MLYARVLHEGRHVGAAQCMPVGGPEVELSEVMEIRTQIRRQIWPCGSCGKATVVTFYIEGIEPRTSLLQETLQENVPYDARAADLFACGVQIPERPAPSRSPGKFRPLQLHLL